ncbi:MAG: MupA/Atu3671 family FMN-dependent luciferase-like monooxygenase [Pseudomonadota bacterium]
MADRTVFSCVVMGDETLLAQCGEELIGRGHDVRAVVTANPNLASWAEQNGLKTLDPAELLNAGWHGDQFDWLFSIANLRLIPGSILQEAKAGAINFHDGPLPRYAGLNTPAWALANGEVRHGITWHEIVEGVDRGDIYLQREFEISQGETALTLNAKCFEAGMSSFAELCDLIEQDQLHGVPQTFEDRTYFAKSKRPDAAATLDFGGSAEDAARLARALDFGRGYSNPVAVPKVRIKDVAYGVGEVEVLAAARDAASGEVIDVDDKACVVATRDGFLRLGLLSDANGFELSPATIVSAGDHLDALSEEFATQLNELASELAQNESKFIARLERQADADLAGATAPKDEASCDWHSVTIEASGFAPADLVTSLSAYVGRTSGQAQFQFGYCGPRLHDLRSAFAGYVAASIPLEVSFDETATLASLKKTSAKELECLDASAGYSGDLVIRYPDLEAPSYSIGVRVSSETLDTEGLTGTIVTLALAENNGATQCQLLFDVARFPKGEAEALARRIAAIAIVVRDDPQKRISDLSLLTDAELETILYQRNATEEPVDLAATVHTLFERQAASTPQSPALVYRDQELTYAELDERANRIANALVAKGVGPDALVGLYMTRTADLVIAALGVLKAGGAYVPLDPDYPADRLGFMIEDSELKILIRDPDGEPPLPKNHAVDVVTIESLDEVSDSGKPLVSRCDASNLAYLIYTSGSTGRPKGVMVEHRNVVNFFAGMDQRVARSQDDSQPVWLAVTSLSFDISVLELFWTLARGFKVVLYSDHAKAASPADHRPAVRRNSSAMNFSLYYWGNDDGAGPRKYKLLLDGAKFADEHGFCAVWTPERHFHAFGGPYPNPSVTGAAVASTTSNVDIRAGSCVLPLHHPARVAEEWAVIDNISNGRAGIAVASGWMPEDFLLRPENAPPNNKTAMFRDLEVVKQLWRGEKVTMTGPTGKDQDVTTLPRPVQKELPVWVTTAGNEDTFRQAAQAGANILTHLLGQSIAEIERKIKVYRDTLRECGRDPDQYTVTLMLHTLVGEDREEVREMAREPMMSYLRSAAGLIKQYAWAFPAFKRPQGAAKAMDLDLQSLEPEEMDAILEFAFLRYFDDSGLFGTVDDAVARAEQLHAVGVNEIACLIDFGVPTETVLESLEPLAAVVSRFGHDRDHVGVVVDEPIAGFSFADLIQRHSVTHLQCTPAMATMLLVGEAERAALANVQHLYIGGEALTGQLMRDLRETTSAPIENMYGPTETTIWSSTMTAQPTATSVPLGKPIVNTQLYVLDSQLRPVPDGVPGELFIGGTGVTRGYFKREELTAERFLDNPFVPGGRMYRTGDLVRYDSEGQLRFLGRTDFQVKVRGYRIELGEIEACLHGHDDIAEAVVVAREDVPGDVRIVAYLRVADGASFSKEILRAHAGEALPEFMVPAHFVKLDAFPLTPNAKVDRNALPKPQIARPANASLKLISDGVPASDRAEPQGELEIKIANAFQTILGVDRVGLNDNFFLIGGHSLLAVQAHRSLKADVAPELTITDLYRFPTVSGLAQHLSNRGQSDQQLSKVANRAAARRQAMARRRA